MESTERVRTHFEKDAQRFDAIYQDDQKSAFSRFVDKYVRGVVVERLHLVRALAPAKGTWSVIDVGCGPGRFSVDLAKRGAARVLGVDISAEMLDLAKRAATSQKVESQCEFVKSSFKDLAVKETFDMSLGIGYFDYLENPIEDLQKMAEVTRGHVIASFPKRYEWRVPVRKVRFMLTGGFVRFYSKAEVLALFAKIGVPPERLYLIDLGRDYVAVARVV
jgi:ubiquinone/menaquinone biosynthesis C-methylase UbiE